MSHARKPHSPDRKASPARWLWRLVGRAWWKGGGNWLGANARSIRAVTWTLYQYLYGWGREPRQRQKRTKARWLWCEEKWIAVERWTAPRFDALVCNGHGEHYGYPRHHAYLLLWWNRRGYALGVEFSVPNGEHEPRRAAK